MSEVLVIGGNGFLGSHLVDALAVTGEHHITVFDMFNGTVRWKAEGVDSIDGNFLNEGDLEVALRGKDIVVHMLSTTDPASAENDPTLDIRTNVMGTVEMLRLCVELDVKHVYFASSGGAIYGDQDKSHFDEDSPTLPVSPYAIGKQTIESYLRFFNRKYGLVSTSIRISNPYGTRQNPHKRQGIIPIFLRQILRGQPLRVMGDGSMVRDYIYVKDLARILAAVITRGATEPVYNLGSGWATSVNDIVDSIRRVTGTDPVIDYVPAPPTYVSSVTLDTSRLEKEFGTFKMTPLDEGIRRTWEEIKAHGR